MVFCDACGYFGIFGFDGFYSGAHFRNNVIEVDVVFIHAFNYCVMLFQWCVSDIALLDDFINACLQRLVIGTEACDVCVGCCELTVGTRSGCCSCFSMLCEVEFDILCG